MKLFNLYSNSNNRTFIQRPFKVSTQKRSLRWPMMLNIAMKKYFQSVRKTKYSKLKESPEADPHTRGTNQQIPFDSWQMIGVQSLFTLGYVDRVERRLPAAIADTGRYRRAVPHGRR